MLAGEVPSFLPQPVRKLLTKYLLPLIVLLLALPAVSRAQAAYDNILQINGVTMTADSLRAVGGTTISVKSKNRGVVSSERGVFSIVVMKGDTLEFSAIGYRPKDYVVPQNILGHFVSLIQLMTQDTFYLAETVIRPLPSREEFDYAFRNLRIPDDPYEIARKNTDAYTMRVLAMTLPKSGAENQAVLQQTYQRASVYYQQTPPSNILSPGAWMNFLESWKRGDFRKKK